MVQKGYNFSNQRQSINCIYQEHERFYQSGRILEWRLSCTLGVDLFREEQYHEAHTKIEQKVDHYGSRDCPCFCFTQNNSFTCAQFTITYSFLSEKVCPSVENPNVGYIQKQQRVIFPLIVEA